MLSCHVLAGADFNVLFEHDPWTWQHAFVLGRCAGSEAKASLTYPPFLHSVIPSLPTTTVLHLADAFALVFQRCAGNEGKAGPQGSGKRGRCEGSRWSRCGWPWQKVKGLGRMQDASHPRWPWLGGVVQVARSKDAVPSAWCVWFSGSITVVAINDVAWSMCCVAFLLSTAFERRLWRWKATAAVFPSIISRHKGLSGLQGEGGKV